MLLEGSLLQVASAFLASEMCDLELGASHQKFGGREGRR